MELINKEYIGNGVLLTFKNDERPYLIPYFHDYYLQAATYEIGKDYDISILQTKLKNKTIEVKGGENDK